MPLKEHEVDEIVRVIDDGVTPLDIARAIDAPICHTSECPNCGHEGMGYEQQKLFDTAHRAFAVCPNCGHREEF